jgi:uncharacterized membrane protein YobD (UPF0266 family)
MHGTLVSDSYTLLVAAAQLLLYVAFTHYNKAMQSNSVAYYAVLIIQYCLLHTAITTADYATLNCYALLKRQGSSEAEILLWQSDAL